MACSFTSENANNLITVRSGGIDIAARLGLADEIIDNARSLISEQGRITQEYISRLAELTAARDRGAAVPLFLLDDVSSELDRARTRRSLRYLSLRMLDDVGIEPGDAMAEANKPFWRA